VSNVTSATAVHLFVNWIIGQGLDKQIFTNI